jgi:hypothetical protein
MSSTAVPPGRPAIPPKPRNNTEQRFIQSRAGGGARRVDPLGTALGVYGKKRKAPAEYLWQNQNGGYNDLLNAYEGGASATDAIQDLLTNFKGSPESLNDFLESAGQLFGGLEAKRFGQSEAYQYTQDSSNWDLGAMGAYGAQAGNIGRNTDRAVRQSKAGLATAGLGRSSANGAVESMLRMEGSGQQAGLFANAQQQAAQNRMSSAGNAMEAHRMLAQMALGQGIQPRINSPQGTEGVGGMGIAQGAASGAATGATAGGPWGAVIGGVAGAGLGYAGSRK